MRTALLLSVGLVSAASQSSAALITSVPGPDDQGGMLMPMVTILATAGTGAAPTAGSIQIAFAPADTPELRSLQDWSPGDWFATDAAWRDDLGSPAGVGGTPVENAGAGALFNNQYGFMFMGMGTMTMANIPEGKSLAIRLVSVSSDDLRSFNYSASANRWDEVFAEVGDQVLWNGSMWHNYFTLPSGSVVGTYTAQFEIFIANTPFTGSTGFAQYDAAALAALADPAFTPANVTYTWTVAAVPEPSAFASMAGAVVLGAVAVRRRRR